MFANGRIWLAYLIVFISSTCVMVIELVAGRIMAPYIGVSLYTWTSIIGIVLAGMSLGNFLGGSLADVRASRGVLGVVFLAGGLCSVGILVTTSLAVVVTGSMDLIPKIVVCTLLIFFLPSVILGMVSPVVVKLALQDIQNTGRTVGTIYAFSTAGSIVGTFVTGFWLISEFGTRTIVWMVGLILILMGLVVGEFWRPKGRLAALAATLLLCGAALISNVAAQVLGQLSTDTITRGLTVAIVGFTILGVLTALGGRALHVAAMFVVLVTTTTVYVGWERGEYRAPCATESDYYCIRISDRSVDGHPVRALVLDHLIHSYVSLDDPKVLGYGYERVYDEVTRYQVAGRDRFDTLFIGGGGYTFPKYIDAMYPNATIDVMEIDPAVTEAAHEYLNLDRNTRIRSFNLDARTFLMHWEDPKKYDLVYGDAFNDLSVPYHLTTVEFDRMIAGRLKDDGIYMINVIDRIVTGEFAKAFMNSLQEVFPHVYLMSLGETWKGDGANTYVVVASRAPLDRQRFEAVAADGNDPQTGIMPDDELQVYLSSGRKIVLTDDYVPVDQLVARLFVARGY